MNATAVTRMLVVTSEGVVLPARQENRDLRIGRRELEVLVALTGDPDVDRGVVDDIADRLGESADELAAFVAELRERRWLADDAGGETHAGNRATDIDVTSVERAVGLPVPSVFPIEHGAISVRDHAGRRIVDLSPVELLAVAVMASPQTVASGYQAQRSRLGADALTDGEFAHLVAVLCSAGVLKRYDEDTLPRLRAHDPQAESMRRERLGHDAVAAATARHQAAADTREAEHRARTGYSRTRVYPVHSLATAWRNPPLSLGLILAYVNSYDDGRLAEHYDVRLDWLISPERIDEFTDEPAVFLFSSYVWSSDANLAISRAIKEANPSSVTIHGGPNVPKYEGDVDAFFATNPHVDIAVRGEGEVTTAEILDRLRDAIVPGQPTDLSVLADVAGLTYRDGDTIVRTADRERLADLDVIPSPYLTGLFDAYVEGWRDVADPGVTGLDGWSYLLPVVVLETNRGCPYGCTFCDWGSATLSRVRKFSLERIFAELDWCAANQVNTVGLADANFGIFERDVEITARVADLKKTVGWPRQFGSNYAKNTVKHLRQIVDLLTDADILTFGLLSLQSMDAQTLSTIDRSNIKLERYEELAVEFRHANLPLYVDLMVGLPGQTVQSFVNDMQECADREVHAKIFPTMLLVNSPMNAPEYRKKHGIVQKPGELVLRTASFTIDDYQRMLDLRLVFFLTEKFGAFRHLARYVRHESGLTELDFYTRLWDDAVADPARWPTLNFTLEVIPRFMVPPGSWWTVLEELRRYCVEMLGVADDAALDTAIDVSAALAPARDRTFPYRVELPHDYVAWHQEVIAAKDAGHLRTWPDVVKPLRTFGAGSLTVTDPRGVCEHELGRPADSNPWDSWDLCSPVSRAVTRGL